MTELFDSLQVELVFFALLFTIQLRFCSRLEAANDVMSGVCLKLNVTDHAVNFGILARTVLEKLDPKPPTAFSAVFFAITANWK